MNSKLLFTFFICAISTISFSQTLHWDTGKIQVVTEDDPDKKLRPVLYGEFSSFQIEDINKFLWMVTISGKRVDLETPMPTELQALFRLTPTQLNATANTKAVDKAVTDVENFFNNPAVQNLANEENLLEKFKTEATEYSTAARSLSDNIQSIKLARIQLVKLAEKDVKFSEMVTAVATVQLPTNPVDEYAILLDKYQSVKSTFDEIIVEVTNTPETKEVITKLMNKVDKSFSTIENENILSSYSDVIFLSTELTNKKNFTAEAPPVQADGDFIKYSVTISPSPTNSLGSYKSPSNFDFEIPVKGGLKVDFSVGPTFSFGSNAKDEKFYTEPSTTEGNLILRERENNNIVSPGLAAMMHFYRRSGSDFSWGGMFGVGAGFQSVEDADISFYTGISLVLGKRQKVMINFGGSFLSVERIKNNEFQTDNEYTVEGFDLSNVTESVIKGSFFLSLSYNLTNRIER
jgi:hypothetical protein